MNETVFFGSLLIGLCILGLVLGLFGIAMGIQTSIMRKEIREMKKLDKRILDIL